VVARWLSSAFDRAGVAWFNRQSIARCVMCRLSSDLHEASGLQHSLRRSLAMAIDVGNLIFTCNVDSYCYYDGMRRASSGRAIPGYTSNETWYGWRGSLSFLGHQDVEKLIQEGRAPLVSHQVLTAIRKDLLFGEFATVAKGVLNRFLESRENISKSGFPIPSTPTSATKRGNFPDEVLDTLLPGPVAFFPDRGELLASFLYKWLFEATISQDLLKRLREMNQMHAGRGTLKNKFAALQAVCGTFKFFETGKLQDKSAGVCWLLDTVAGVLFGNSPVHVLRENQREMLQSIRNTPGGKELVRLAQAEGLKADDILEYTVDWTFDFMNAISHLAVHSIRRIQSDPAAYSAMYAKRP